MDANTVRTYEIPIHISPHTLENYPEFAFPPGFTPSQQFPYNVSSASSQVSFLHFLCTVNFRFKHVRFEEVFDLRKNFTVPKILVHKMFDLRKISRTPFFDLRKKNQVF